MARTQRRKLTARERADELHLIDAAIAAGERYHRITYADVIAYHEARRAAWSDKNTRWAIMLRIRGFAGAVSSRRI